MPTDRRSHPRVLPWMVYLAAGAVAVGIHASLETSSLIQSFTYDAIGASAVAFALFGVWRHRPDRVMPWLLMALGQGLFVAGDLAWNYYEIIGEDRSRLRPTPCTWRATHSSRRVCFSSSADAWPGATGAACSTPPS